VFLKNRIRNPSRSTALLELVNFCDDSLSSVDGKFYSVARLQPLDHRRGADFVAHRHRVHEILDRAVLNHDLLGLRNNSNDLAATLDELGWSGWLKRRYIGRHVYQFPQGHFVCEIGHRGGTVRVTIFFRNYRIGINYRLGKKLHGVQRPHLTKLRGGLYRVGKLFTAHFMAAIALEFFKNRAPFGWIAVGHSEAPIFRMMMFNCRYWTGTFYSRIGTKC